MSANPNYIGTPRNTAMTDVQTTPHVLYVAGPNGARIHAITAENGSTSTRNLVLSWGASNTTGNADQVHLNVVALPGNSGQTTSNHVVDVLDHTAAPWLDPSPGRFLTLGPNEALFVNLTVAATSPVKVLAMGADY